MFSFSLRRVEATCTLPAGGTAESRGGVDGRQDAAVRGAGCAGRGRGAGAGRAPRRPTPVPPIGATAVHRRSRWPPTTMKSPVATTDPSPFDPCQRHPVRRHPAARPGLHAAGARGRAALPLRRRQLPDGRRADRLAQPTSSRCPPTRSRPTINGHRAAQFWVHEADLHNSYWYISCMVAFKTSYGVIQQSLYYSTVVLQPRRRLPVHQPAARQRPAPYYKF